MELKEFYDEYGYLNMWPQEKIDEYTEVSQEREAKQLANTLSYLKSINGIENLDKKDVKFKELMRGGLPSGMRPLFWCHLLDIFSVMKRNPKAFTSSLENSDAIPQSVKDVIQKDVDRTFVTCKTFTKEQLTHVLYFFALSNPDIMYCQSLNFMAALLITVLGEEPAAHALNKIVNDYLPADYYQGGMKGFQVDLVLLEMLIKERIPELDAHAKSLQHQWLVSSSGWLLTIFANAFNVATVLRVWDSILLEGPKIVFRVALGFLKENEAALLKCTNIASFTKTLSEAEKMVDPDRLMSEAFGLRLFSRQHLVELRRTAEDAVARGRGSSEINVGVCLQSLFGKLHL